MEAKSFFPKRYHILYMLSSGLLLGMSNNVSRDFLKFNGHKIVNVVRYFKHVKKDYKE